MRTIISWEQATGNVIRFLATDITWLYLFTLEYRVAHVSLWTVFKTSLDFRKMKSQARILLKLSSLGLRFWNNGLGVSASLRFYHLPPLYHNMLLCFLINLNITSYAMTETSCTQARNQDFMWRGGVLTRPKWTKLPKCIFYCPIRLYRKVAIHEKLQRQSTR